MTIPEEPALIHVRCDSREIPRKNILHIRMITQQVNCLIDKVLLPNRPGGVRERRKAVGTRQAGYDLIENQKMELKRNKP